MNILEELQRAERRVHIAQGARQNLPSRVDAAINRQT